MPDIDPTQQHGGQHPLVGSDQGRTPWQVTDDADYGPLWAWHLQDGAVALQGADGDVVIPASQLAMMGRALLAQHVANGQARFKEPVR